MPKSRAKIGAINNMLNKVDKGYIPRQNETKKVYRQKLIKNNMGKKRPLIRLGNQYYSKRKGMNFSDVIFGISDDMLNGKNVNYVPLDYGDYDEGLAEELYSIAERLIGNNKISDWNDEFSHLGIDGSVEWIYTLR